MFQCLGLKSEEEGGCGEDWWHPECVIWGPEKGSRRRKEIEVERTARKGKKTETDTKESNGETNGQVTSQSIGDATSDLPQEQQNEDVEAEHDENELPQGFPDEDDFDTFICYKCVDALPLLKQYAGAEGFLPAVFKRDADTEAKAPAQLPEPKTEVSDTQTDDIAAPVEATSGRKRSADEADLDTDMPEADSKKSKPDASESASSDPFTRNAYHTTLTQAPAGTFSLFCTSSFRTSLCRCRTCYPLLAPYPMLLEEEDSYEPPMSDSGDPETAGSVGSKSILDMGEEALSNVDRVRAIEGVMAYNHLKEKVKGFLRPFAESGTPVGAEDIKKYFEGLRGDEMGRVGQDGGKEEEGGGEGEGDGRHEQSGTSPSLHI